MSKIAVFFDCENISASYVDDIFSELVNEGEVIIKQAYKDWTSRTSKSWNAELLQKYAITPVQIMPNTKRQKNTSDIQIVIDVLETIFNLKVDVVALVSSDSDFTALANKVKTKSISVYGFGEEKTPYAFRNACSVFVELPINKTNKIKDELLEIVKDAINQTKQDNGFALVAQIGQYLKNKNASYIAKNFGQNSWGDILKAYPDDFIIEYANDKSTLLAKIR